MSWREKLNVKGRAMSPTTMLIKKWVSFLKSTSKSQQKKRIPKPWNASLSIELSNSIKLISKPQIARTISKTKSTKEFQQLAKGYWAPKTELRIFKVNLDTDSDGSRSWSRTKWLGSFKASTSKWRDSNFTTNDSLNTESYEILQS
jgi:hypothetical protein